jgi:hypothetical protein
MGDPAKDPPLPEAHEAAPRSKSQADANLIPSSRTRVGDGTIDPSTLPRVRKDSGERRTLTHDEYYEWQQPPIRRTTPAAAFVRYCQNPNCSKPRDFIDQNGEARIEPFPGGRCRACYQYRQRHDGNERPRERVIRDRERKAWAEALKPAPGWKAAWFDEELARLDPEAVRRAREEIKKIEARDRISLPPNSGMYLRLELAIARREHEDVVADWRYWRDDGICKNGHHVTPDELDPEGRCKQCRNHYYNTGGEPPFDVDAFMAGNAEPAERRDLARWRFLEPDDDPDNEIGLSDENRAVLGVLKQGTPRRPPGQASDDQAVPSWLHPVDEPIDDPADDGGWGLDPGELGKL